MRSLILIGMPAAGKSAIGKLAAGMGGAVFTDGDDLIRERTGKSLSEVISERGTDGFLSVEEEVLCGYTPVPPFVFAPGGSAVYSPRAMAHLKTLGKVVYLCVPLCDLLPRIPDFTARGVVMRGAVTSLKELYEERVPLYERYADVTVDCAGKTPREIAEELLKL